MTETSRRGIDDFLLNFGFVGLSPTDEAKIDLKFQEPVVNPPSLESEEMYLNKAFFIASFRKKVELINTPSLNDFYKKANLSGFSPFPFYEEKNEDNPQQKNFVVGFGR